MLVLGTTIAVLMNLDKITSNVVLSGMISGLASTGGYEAVHQFLKGVIDDKGSEGVEGIEGINNDEDH